jgi:hypothetical protein
MEWWCNGRKRLLWYSDMRLVMLSTKGVKLGEVGWEDTLTSKVEEQWTRGGQVSDRPEVYKLTMVRMFIENWRTFECKDLKVEYIEMYMPQKCSKYGWVEIWITKIHILLQAISSLQVYRKHLRSNVQIELSEQGKVRTWSDNTRRSGRLYKFT